MDSVAASNAQSRVATRAKDEAERSVASASEDKAERSAATQRTECDAVALLGNTETKDNQQVRGTRLTGAYAQACWSLMADAWRFSSLKRVRGCHRWLAPNAGAASVQWAPGQARWGNLQNSHSIWSSPMAAARIARLRSAEIKRAVDTWSSQGNGSHGVEFLTLTVRHKRGQSLSEVWDVVTKCWKSAVGGASWHGGKRYEGDKNRYGVAHWVRSVEVTFSRKNGWHVHVHALMLTKKRLSKDERETLENRMFERWKNAALRAGFQAPTRERGIKLVEAMDSNNTAAIGEYLAKGQTSKLAMEVASGQTSKLAGKQSRTPFQILGDIGRAYRAGKEYASDLAIYHEWEQSSNGRRAIAWSKGAKSELGLVDLDDEELLEQDDAEHFADPYAVAMVPREAWHKPAAGRDEKLCDDVQTRTAIIDAVKIAKSPEEARDKAAKVLEELGIYSLAVLAKVNAEKKTREQVEEKRELAKEKARKQASEFASMLRAVG